MTWGGGTSVTWAGSNIESRKPSPEASEADEGGEDDPTDDDVGEDPSFTASNCEAQSRSMPARSASTVGSRWLEYDVGSPLTLPRGGSTALALSAGLRARLAAPSCFASFPLWRGAEGKEPALSD